jgi:hypothetical protein
MDLDFRLEHLVVLMPRLIRYSEVVCGGYMKKSPIDKYNLVHLANHMAGTEIPLPNIMGYMP